MQLSKHDFWNIYVRVLILLEHVIEVCSFFLHLIIQSQFLRMIPFSDIFFNAILESLDGVVNFSVILGYGIRQNVKYVQILTVFVSLNDAILDDGYFLNSCAEKQILLSEQFHDEESVVRDGFSAD